MRHPEIHFYPSLHLSPCYMLNFKNMQKEEVDFLGRLLYNKNYDTPEKKSVTEIHLLPIWMHYLFRFKDSFTSYPFF